jgi:16S rRNA (guanine966-N2)-methyltransferase
LRPTGDRLRETLFNWVSPFVADAHCLDLFAGSGALGLEAVSRGAASATLVELSAVACNALREQARVLSCSAEVMVHHADARQWLSQERPRPFNLIFLDPPFDSGLLADTIPLLASAGWLAHDARIYVETDRSKVTALPDNWRLLRSIETGQVRCQLLQSIDPDHTARSAHHFDERRELAAGYSTKTPNAT